MILYVNSDVNHPLPSAPLERTAARRIGLGGVSFMRQAIAFFLLLLPALPFAVFAESPAVIALMILHEADVRDDAFRVEWGVECLVEDLEKRGDAVPGGFHRRRSIETALQRIASERFAREI